MFVSVIVAASKIYGNLGLSSSLGFCLWRKDDTTRCMCFTSACEPAHAVFALGHCTSIGWVAHTSWASRWPIFVSNILSRLVCILLYDRFERFGFEYNTEDINCKCIIWRSCWTSRHYRGVLRLRSLWMPYEIDHTACINAISSTVYITIGDTHTWNDIRHSKTHVVMAISYDWLPVLCLIGHGQVLLPDAV